MLKNENKRDNLFILTNVINVSEHSRDFSRRSDILGNVNTGGIVVFKYICDMDDKNLLSK